LVGGATVSFGLEEELPLPAIEIVSALLLATLVIVVVAKVMVAKLIRKKFLDMT
jgi:hypothetical protein